MSTSDVPLPISFKEQEKDDAYRGTMVANRAMQDTSLNLKTDQMSGKTASIQAQTQAFGGKSNEIVTLELDEAGSKLKGKQKAPQNIFAIEVVPDQQSEVFNDVSSYSVPNTDCAAVIQKLSTVLSSYSNEIDFVVDTDKNEIKNGVAFINNYYSVFFTIWTATENDKGTRFEFRRQSGDALASAKFLGDIKSLFFGKEDTKDAEENTLIALDLNVKDLELKVNDEQKEMMMIHEALISDEIVGNSLEEDAENYLYQKLVENKAIDSKDAIDHKILCKTLINKEMLLHRDICVVRASLLILNKFAIAGTYNELLLSKTLFSLMNDVMKNQRCALVKKYVVQLLADLAADNKWELDEALRDNLSAAIKGYQDKAKNAKDYDAESFKRVYGKLST